MAVLCGLERASDCEAEEGRGDKRSRIGGGERERCVGVVSAVGGAAESTCCMVGLGLQYSTILQYWITVLDCSVERWELRFGN
jgi:hypothetical protein